MVLSPAVKQRRDKGKRWTNRIALYLLITTPIMLLLWLVTSYSGSGFAFFLSVPLLLINPFSVMVTSFCVLPIPVPVWAAVVMILVALPYVGCRMLNERRCFGKKLFVAAKAATLVISAILIFFMFYSSYWLRTTGLFLILPVPCIVIPAIELYLVNMWIPEDSIPRKKP